ncbi:uncharacterized protein LOC124495050 [Dermatophagoides farinae]|uniref:uncharacterized protein LOC124495050 n=1 Tax=Dermatophagoides farinae TaxID=6954 RepID=UPI003F5DBA79
MDDDEFLAELKKRLSEQEAKDQSKNVFESNIELLNIELKNMVENEPAREKLLEIVDCQKVLDFGQVFNIDEFIEQRFEYFGSGTFGKAILMYRGRRYTEKMIKTIRCLPEKLAANIYSSAMSYGDIYKEALCIKILSKLSSGITINENQSLVESDHEYGDVSNLIVRQGQSDSNDTSDSDDEDQPEPLVESRRPRKRYRFQTKCFPFLYKIYLCNNEAKSLINFESIMPSSDTNRLPMNNVLETIIIIMEHCGEKLRELMDRTIITPLALISIFKQIVIGIAIVESIYNFEHRDLHIDNIICKETKSRWIKFVYMSKKYKVLSMGFEAKIIDFGYSRFNYCGKIYYKNLDQLDCDDSDSDDPYNAMSKLFKPNGGGGGGGGSSSSRWSNYSNQSNFVWIKDFVKKLLEYIDICYRDNPQTAVEIREEGPSISVWYRILDRRFGPKQLLLKPWQKVMIDQATFNPSIHLMAIIVLGLMSQESFKAIKTNIHDNYVDIMKNSYKVWPAVQMVNFYLIPLNYR